MSLFIELKRRNVIRVGAIYLVVAWLLIQVTETIFPLFGMGKAPARLVVIAVAIGFIPTLVFAWVYELTPEGLKKEKDVERSQSISPRVGRKLDRMIMLALVLALVLFAFDKFVLSPKWQTEQLQEARLEARGEALVASYGDHSIAVLPFVDMSINKDQEYMSDGIAEELLNLLTKIPQLRVISRTSAFSFKDKNLKIADVARELNAAHVLVGSIRKSANQVRITVQLIEARSDTHLWSETYDRTLDNIFDIQDEIATAVVAKLKLTLLGETPTVDEIEPDAYALYLQARHLWRMGTSTGFEQAIELYREALTIAPAYADAWAGLGLVYMSQRQWGLRPYNEGFTMAREALRQALVLDPRHAPSHSRLSNIAMIYDNDLQAAARHMQQALALDATDGAVLSNTSVLLFTLGRFEEAIALNEYLVARDPVNPTIYYNLAVSYRFTGRLDEAIASYRTVLRLNPDNFRARLFLGEALLIRDEPEAALAIYEQEDNAEWQTWGVTLAFHALGRHSEFEAAFTELRERWRDESPSRVAAVYAWIGDTNLAFDWLDVAMERDGEVEQHDPLFTKLYNDPRWPALLEKIGRSPTQLAAIEFTVTLPEQEKQIGQTSNH